MLGALVTRCAKRQLCCPSFSRLICYYGELLQPTATVCLRALLGTPFEIQLYMFREINTTCGWPVWLEHWGQLQLTEVDRPEGKLLKTLLLMWEGRTRITKWGGCLTIQESQGRCFSLIKRRSWILTKEWKHYLVLARLYCMYAPSQYIACWNGRWSGLLCCCDDLLFLNIKKLIKIYQNESGKKCTGVTETCSRMHSPY